jgi:hypothetical protein
MAPRNKHVVELFLRGAGLLPIVDLSLLFEHIGQGFAIAMRGLIDFQLLKQLACELFKLLKKKLLSLRCSSDLAQRFVDLEGRRWPLQGLFTRLLSCGNLGIDHFHLAPHARDRELNLLERTLFTLLRMLANEKHGRKWKSKCHDQLVNAINFVTISG